MRDINIADLQKFTDKQAENFARVQLDLNSIMAFLQLLLNIESRRLSDQMGIPFETVQIQMNQTLSKIQSDINQATLESAKLFAEFQKNRTDR